METSALGSGQEYDPDANLYAAACISCHYNSGTSSPSRASGTSTQQRAHADRTDQFHSGCAEGDWRQGRCAGPGHAAYASSFTDAEWPDSRLICAAPAPHCPPWTDLEKKVASARRELAASR